MAHYPVSPYGLLVQDLMWSLRTPTKNQCKVILPGVKNTKMQKLTADSDSAQKNTSDIVLLDVLSHNF